MKAFEWLKGLGGSKTPALTYEDLWLAFMRQSDQGNKVVGLNEGIAAVMDNMSSASALELIVTFDTAPEQDMATPEQSEQLAVFDDELFDAIQSAGGHYLARITGQGKRSVFVMSNDPESMDVLQAVLEKTVHDAGLFGVISTHENARDLYWDTLSPNAEERREAGDALVLNQLAQHDDLSEEPRLIEHWSFFPSVEMRDRMIAWLQANEFGLIEENDAPNEPEMPYALRFAHFGPAILDEVLRYTLPADQMSRSLGGAYDGWETLVVRTPGTGLAEAHKVGWDGSD